MNKYFPICVFRNIALQENDTTPLIMNMSEENDKNVISQTGDKIEYIDGLK